MQAEAIIMAVLDSDPSMTPEQRKRVLDALKAPQSEQPQTMSRKDVSKIFGVHPGSLKRWEKAGKITPLKITARTVRYDAREIRAIVEGAA